MAAVSASMDATDVEPSSGGTLDKGVQLRRPTNGTLNSCAISSISNVLNLPALESNRGQKLHKWVTPPIPSGFNDVLLTGEANLSLWTQTLNGAEHAGKICIYLFRRTTVAGLRVWGVGEFAQPVCRIPPGGGGPAR